MKHPSDSTEFYMLATEGFEKMIMHTLLSLGMRMVNHTD